MPQATSSNERCQNKFYRAVTDSGDNPVTGASPVGGIKPPGCNSICVKLLEFRGSVKYFSMPGVKQAQSKLMG